VIPTLTVRTRSHWKELTTRLAGLSERLSVGVFQGVTESGDSLAEILACQEYGTSTIPARPSLGPTMRQMRAEIVRQLEQIAGDAIRDTRVPRAGLENLGRQLSEAVQKRIRSTDIPPPLAASTVARKRASMAPGVSADKPLIHTGLMVASLTWRLS
jgi:hypothetical protein